MSRPLAYVFWHQPKPGVDAGAYEGALVAFHARLAERPPSGFRRSRAFAIPETPWLPGGGYEDWYVVDDFAALGQLNAGAVDSDHLEAHDAAAQAAGFGSAGVYALIAGHVETTGPVHSWSASKPSGPGPIWQRQMTLGPTPEFCAITNGDDSADGEVPLRPLWPPLTMSR